MAASSTNPQSGASSIHVAVRAVSRIVAWIGTSIDMFGAARTLAADLELGREPSRSALNALGLKNIQVPTARG